MSASLPPKRLLAEDHYIRAKMFDGDKSSIRRYADLVVGEGASYWKLLQYELITCLFGGLPGALGLALRRLFYPMLFQSAGKGAVFGRHIVVRNGHNIRLGDHVVLDDGCVVDGRGAGPEGVVIGSRVIIGRHTTVQAKIGPIHIGDDCDIGAASSVHSQGGVHIGRGVVLGGGCKLSGGIFQIERSAAASAEASGMSAREQIRATRGPIRIGDRCLVGMGAMFLDGVEIGEGAVIGAGSVMVHSVPAHAVAAGVPGRLLRLRGHASAEKKGRGES
jgi:acetyltransferase-like isoleucine patch superfamily enzyme